MDELWADIGKAQNKLNWKPKWTLRDMCAHSWKWQSKYPMGYRTLLNIQQQQHRMVIIFQVVFRFIQKKIINFGSWNFYVQTLGTHTRHIIENK